MMVELLNADFCCGCAACMDKCPKDAIQMRDDTRGNRRPFVNKDKCISCSLCTKVCPSFNISNNLTNEKIAYVGYFNQKESLNSSSGGIFFALAQYVIKQNGIVYGAAMKYEGDKLLCKHIRVDKIEDLSFLQGSKYVQSHTDGIYSQVLEDIKNNKLVLFSGTSCQIASLKRFVGPSDNLYTIDLICHGVPQNRVFNDYITFLENQNHGKIINMSFRKKGVMCHGVEMTKILTYLCKKHNGSSISKSLLQTQSAYYCLFMNRAGYRDSCYHCLYASSNKPADITLGDFTPFMEEVRNYQLSKTENYSSIIVHTQTGKLLLKQVEDVLLLKEIPVEYMLKRHGNLNKPSETTKEGRMLYEYYNSRGFQKLQRLTDYYHYRTEIRLFLDTIKMKIKQLF